METLHCVFGIIAPSECLAHSAHCCQEVSGCGSADSLLRVKRRDGKYRFLYFGKYTGFLLYRQMF